MTLKILKKLWVEEKKSVMECKNVQKAITILFCIFDSWT